MLKRGKMMPDIIGKILKIRKLSFVARTAEISYFPKTQLSVTDLQLTLELSFILSCLGWKRFRINIQAPRKVLVETDYGNKRWPYGFRLESSIIVANAKFDSFSCNLSFFPSALPQSLVVKGLEANPIQGKKTCVNCAIWIHTTMERYFNEGWVTGLHWQSKQSPLSAC